MESNIAMSFGAKNDGSVWHSNNFKPELENQDDPGEDI